MAKFEVSREGTLKAWYDISLPGYLLTHMSREEASGKICFHLTDEGLIVDIFDNEGNAVETYGRTAQEFADWML